MIRSILIWLAVGNASTAQAQPWTNWRSASITHSPIISVQKNENPATNIGDRVKRILIEHLGLKSTPEGNAKLVEDLHVDDLDLVEVVMALEVEFEITIPDDFIETVITVDDVINVVRTAAR